MPPARRPLLKLRNSLCCDFGVLVAHQFHRVQFQWGCVSFLIHSTLIIGLLITFHSIILNNNLFAHTN